jgi:hypothetical protein
MEPYRICSFVLLVSAFFPQLLPGQTSPELQEILQRLRRLEDQNRELAGEVHTLRRELADARKTAPPPAPPAGGRGGEGGGEFQPD